MPILAGEEVVGFIGACGAREPDVEVETFLASRTLEVSEEALETPMSSVGVITPEVLQRTVQVIQQKLAELPS